MAVRPYQVSYCPLADMNPSTRAEVEYQQAIKNNENEWWLIPDERDFWMLAFGFTRQSAGANGWRGRRSPRRTRVLDSMPLVCGDALQDHVTDLSTVHAQAEVSIINNMHGAPLIAWRTTVFAMRTWLTTCLSLDSDQRVPTSAVPLSYLACSCR